MEGSSGENTWRRESHEQAIEILRGALGRVRFGTVTVILQDGVVVQVEQTERHRLQRPPR